MELPKIQQVLIPADEVQLEGELALPEETPLRGWVIFAHGAGSSRLNARKTTLARMMNQGGFGTLVVDLLKPSDYTDPRTAFNIDVLAKRLEEVTRWLREQEEYQGLPVAYFGANTGVAAALRLAAKPENDIFALASRGGRPDLAIQSLASVTVPTLLIVGSGDETVIELNRYAFDRLPHARIAIVPGAGHHFEEPGTLEEVGKQALAWFNQALTREPAAIRTRA